MTKRPTGRPSALVITDLDGTLLDHHNYDWQPAQAALNRLQKKHIPVVFNTSKTFEESRQLQAEMGLDGPLIVENGSCIHEGTTRKPLGASRDEIRAWLSEANAKQRYQYRSFTELGLAGVIRETGLSEEKAQSALQRQWSEPLLWKDSREAVDQLKAEAQSAGFNVLVGGRFVHLLGDCDKGRAVLVLAEQHQADGRRPRIVALGDSPNDVAMLQVADYPVWVRSPVAEAPSGVVDSPDVFITKEFGPQGWAEAIDKLDGQGVFDE